MFLFNIFIIYHSKRNEHCSYEMILFDGDNNNNNNETNIPKGVCYAIFAVVFLFSFLVSIANRIKTQWKSKEYKPKESHKIHDIFTHEKRNNNNNNNKCEKTRRLQRVEILYLCSVQLHSRDWRLHRVVDAMLALGCSTSNDRERKHAHTHRQRERERFTLIHTNTLSCGERLSYIVGSA